MHKPDRLSLCHLDEVADGSAKGVDPFQAGKDALFLVRTDGELRAWRNSCPHVPGSPMAWQRDAYLNAAKTHIACHAHGALFDPKTGACVKGPCLGKSLTSVPLHVTDDGEVIVSLQKIKETGM